MLIGYARIGTLLDDCGHPSANDQLKSDIYRGQPKCYGDQV